MVLKINSISSGSSGNCYIMENGCGNQVYYYLVDCGISYNTLRDFCIEHLVNMDLITHIFITHEHSDHIKGLKYVLKNHPHITVVLSKRIKENVFKDINNMNNTRNLINNNAVNNISKSSQNDYRVEYISINTPFLVHNIEVYPFETSHDCINPLNFIFKDVNSQRRIGFFTDLGEFTMYHVQLAKLCSIVVVESNYDEHLAITSRMHQNYIGRLLSSKGHLSNLQAQEFISLFAREHQIILLAHISENVNSYERVFTLVDTMLTKLSQINIMFHVCFQNSYGEWVE
ncbi:MAG: MBL fold metallo-hydrolase [Candidatus Nanoarchaeia archaeon]